ncbi:hypothetical protein JTB14_013199 [Gonioctena quinquepunctata]|nr:hypothetical protein JTB14_013199 [Gonioctena quinquepunctata]
MLCSCKAGSSVKCKHISAFLVKCFREDVESLGKKSPTDIKSYLLEIKCSVKGSTKTITEALQEIIYVIQENGDFKLNKRIMGR